MSKASDILDNVSKVIVGKRNVSELVLTSIIAGGHVLLEDVPGTGKTMMSKAFAKSIDGQFSRIQFTPDLLPSDIPLPATDGISRHPPYPAYPGMHHLSDCRSVLSQTLFS